MVEAVRLDQISNPDVDRNKRALSVSSITPYRHILEENGHMFNFHIFENTKNPDGPMYFVLHDNENTAFDSAVRALTKYGGRLVSLETGERRMNNGVDSNRIFGSEYPEYTAFIESMLKPEKPIIAFHNNVNGRALGISMDRYPNGYKTADSSIAGFYHGGDEDDIVWIAGRNSLKETTWARDLIDKMAPLGVNVVYETAASNKDGSMSNWAGSLGYQYMNIEAEIGASSRMNHMVDSVFPVLGITGGKTENGNIPFFSPSRNSP